MIKEAAISLEFQNFRVPKDNPFLPMPDDLEQPKPLTPENGADIRNYRAIVIEPNGFNATRIPSENGNDIVIFRRAIGEGRWGEPDLNLLVQRVLPKSDMAQSQIIEAEADSDFHLSQERVIFDPRQLGDSQDNGRDVVNEEDLRADVYGNIGLTVVERVTSDDFRPDLYGKPRVDYIPYPAKVRLPKHLIDEMPEVKVLRELGPGKNLTPQGRLINGQETFLFRPEGEKHNHALQVVTYDEDQERAQVVQTLNFPETAWSKWRMGTAGEILWLDDKRGVLPIHGINKSGTSEADEKYSYSIGLSLVEKDGSGNLQVVKVAEDPLITGPQLEDLAGERQPDKRSVAYCCGNWEVETNGVREYNFLINKGDVATILVTMTQEQALQNLFADSKQSIDQQLLDKAA